MFKSFTGYSNCDTVSQWWHLTGYWLSAFLWQHDTVTSEIYQTVLAGSQISFTLLFTSNCPIIGLLMIRPSWLSARKLNHDETVKWLQTSLSYIKALLALCWLGLKLMRQASLDKPRERVIWYLVSRRALLSLSLLREWCFFKGTEADSRGRGVWDASHLIWASVARLTFLQLHSSVWFCYMPEW